MTKTALDKTTKIEPELIAFRRLLHSEPELSEQEFKTQEKIMAKLEDYGIPYQKESGKRNDLCASRRSLQT